MDVIVGTAGHIDHGKTALVKALTGVDADRLPEEKQRGITIDLGFAELDLGDIRIGFVDVPGHERFIKNMLAGASGIDLVLLVIAADEGVMPQTREHFDICRLLGVRSGIVVLTKCDLVDSEMLELARLDAAELVDRSFLENAPVVEVSARSGAGISDLTEAIRSAAAGVPKRGSQLISRLSIDRSFSVKGFGAVVTGTLVSGAIRDGDELELMPAGTAVRVRGLQTHNKKVDSATTGQRTAVNLAGIDHSDIHRGMTLCERGVLRPTQILDTEVEVLATAKAALRSRQRVRVHIGTVEALARVAVLSDEGSVATGETGLVQLRLESPVVAVPDERFIIRSYSPQVTIAGGRVIDPHAEKHRRKDLFEVRAFLTTLSDPNTYTAVRSALIIRNHGRKGISLNELRARTGLRTAALSPALAPAIKGGQIIAIGDIFLDSAAAAELSIDIVDAVSNFHARQPIARGISIEALRESVDRHSSQPIYRYVLSALDSAGTLTVENDHVRLAGYLADLAPDEKAASEHLRSIYRLAGFEVPRLDEALRATGDQSKLPPQKVRSLFQMLLDRGEIVKVTDEFYFTRESLERLVEMLRTYAGGTPDRLIDVPRFKDIAAISRKYAIPLLEYFDRERITRRAADKRIIL